MVNKSVFVFGVFLALALSISSVSAVIFTQAGSVTNPDNFYSPYETWINVSTNATVTGAGDSILSVKANFTAINSTACGNGYLSLSYANGYWTGNCSVSSFINASQITPVQKNISFVVENSTGNFSSMQQIGAPVVIMLHNLGVPNMSDPTGCTRFGAATTNLSSTAITDFANVGHYAIHIQVNYTCISGGSFRGAVQDVFNDALLINLTTINMTASDIGSKLSNLRTTVQVNITNPRTFGASRVNVNTSAFGELNTAAKVTLYNVPIFSWNVDNSVTGENIGNLNGIQNGGFNGYSSTLGVSSWNMTLDVAGFSGYNITDNVVPTLSFVTPSSNSYSRITSAVINISINGTGSEISKVRINITNSTGEFNYTSYNASVNTANCVATTTGGDFYYCSINVTFVTNKNYTINATAWDYGGVSPGNVNVVSTTITIDNTAPTLNSVSEDASTTSVAISYNASEAVNVTIKYGTTSTSLGSAKSVSTYTAVSHVDLTSLTSDERYYYNITICDQAGNCLVDGPNGFDTDDTGSSSTSGDGGGYEASFWTSTYSPAEENLSAGYQKALAKGGRIRFKVGQDSHYVGITKITSTEVTVNVSSTPQTAVLNVGETEKFEVSGDSYYDVSVTIDSIAGSKANVTVKTIYEKMTAEQIAAAGSASQTGTTPTTGEDLATAESLTTSTPTASASEKSLLKSTWFWVIVAVLVIVLAGTIYYLFFGKKLVAQRSVKIRES